MPDSTPSPTGETALSIDVRGLRVVLGEQTALRGVSLGVAPGSCVALIGPNGAGKSTLLRALAGLVRPERGEIHLFGMTLTADPWRARRAVGVVGHQPMLYPELSAAENLRFYAALYGLDHAADRVVRGLERVGLSERAGSRAGTLSRGMQQRLSLARALLHEPPILLLDEAESGLDATATNLLLGLLRADAGRRTVVLASHDLAFVQAAATEAVVLRAGRVTERLPLAGRTAAWLQEQYAEILARPLERGALASSLASAGRP